MRIKIMYLLLALCVFMGCSGKVYHGRYITVRVPQDPIDEFEHEGWTILAFQHELRTAEGTIFTFWLFRNGDKKREMWLTANVVGSRKYFLKEKIGEEVISYASFIAQPKYEGVKEQVKIVLTKEAEEKRKRGS